MGITLQMADSMLGGSQRPTASQRTWSDSPVPCASKYCVSLKSRPAAAYVLRMSSSCALEEGTVIAMDTVGP